MSSEKIKGLRTVVYKVDKLEEAKKWYARAFKTDPYHDHPLYVGFNIGGFELGLQPEEPPVKMKGESVIAYWGVDDIEKQLEYFHEVGATDHEPVTAVGGELKIASVKDPWGNIIGLIYNPEFKDE